MKGGGGLRSLGSSPKAAPGTCFHKIWTYLQDLYDNNYLLNSIIEDFH